MKYSSKLFLFVIVFILSCKSDDFTEEINTDDIVKNKIDFKVNGETPENTIHNLSASLCCSNKINISFVHRFNNGQSGSYGGTGLNFAMDKDGNLLGLTYNTYSPNNKYHSPFFTPISTVNISDFEFTENQILNVKIDGRLFKKTYNLYDEPDFIDIEADIEIKDFNNCICNSFTSKITNDNELVFHKITRRQQANDIEYFAHSNNGYHIELINLNERIRNMPLGVYEFDETSTSQRINFRKFIGTPRAFSFSIIQDEWLKYDTSGSFEIFNRQQIGNDLVTSVKLNFVAKHNNEIVFEFNDTILQTQM